MTTAPAMNPRLRVVPLPHDGEYLVVIDRLGDDVADLASGEYLKGVRSGSGARGVLLFAEPIDVEPTNDGERPA